MHRGAGRRRGGDSPTRRGSAASLAVFSLLRPGDHVVAPIECYHGTAKQLRDIIGPMGVQHTFVDMTSIDAVRAALTTQTRLIWIETPSNPMLNISDIAALGASSVASAVRWSCCDNTFATPVWQRPFELGADLVMHSSTKYFGGHSDVMGGARRRARARRARPSSCAMLSGDRRRGALAVRLLADPPQPRDACPAAFARRRRTRRASLEFLSRHRRVERVFYPGLEAHPEPCDRAADR